jgi:hypothetical protein
LHLLFRDAKDDRATIGVRDNEAFMFELSERLPHRPTARVKFACDAVFDKALAILVAAHRDLLAKHFKHGIATWTVGTSTPSSRFGR